MQKITAAQRVSLDERTDVRDAVGAPVSEATLFYLNEKLEDNQGTLVAGLIGWGPYTHTGQFTFGVFHVIVAEFEEVPAPDEEGCVPCRICGQPTPFVGSTFCHGCWEVNHRIEEFLTHPAGVERVREALAGRVTFDPKAGVLRVPVEMLAELDRLSRAVAPNPFDHSARSADWGIMFDEEDRESKWVEAVARIVGQSLTDTMLKFVRETGRTIAVTS